MLIRQLFSRSPQICYLIINASAGIVLISGSSAIAQNVTLDGTLGTAQTLTGPNYFIRQADGQTIGSNLFQSFGKFSLNTGESAIFQSTPAIRNILSRVTGGSASEINGLIRTESRNVNLFLINPNGIIFGPNARLNIGSATRGSFVATTIDTLVWSNGGFFSAINPSSNSLINIVGDPSGFVSTLPQPAAIQTTRSSLRVAQGQSLLFLGGAVNLNNSALRTNLDSRQQGGRVEVGALAASGTVGLDINGNQMSLSFPDGVARADVSLNNNSTIEVEAASGGSIGINARNLALSERSSLRAGISERLGIVGSQAGNIDINSTGTVSTVNSEILNNVNPDSVGNGGNINIFGRSLLFNNNSNVQTSTYGTGNAGSITLQALEDITVNNSRVRSNVERFRSPGTGNSGNINISAGRSILNNRATFESITFGNGNSGNISLQATEKIVFDNSSKASTVVQRLAKGDAGNLTISGRELLFNNRSFVEASTLGTGNAGFITIEAKDKIDFDRASGVLSSVIGYLNRVVDPNIAVGNGGNIAVTAPSLSLRNRSLIEASTYSKGNAGNITIRATDAITVDNSRVSTIVLDETAVGNGGNINISARSLLFSNRGLVEASTLARGNAGNVTLQAAENITFNNNSQALSFVGPNAVGNGGNIFLQGQNIFFNNDSFISANTSGQGNAGKITINAGDTIAFNNSSASSKVDRQAVGQGGRIEIKGRALFLNNGAQISASTDGNGIGGSIDIQTNDSINIANINPLTRNRSGLFTNTNSPNSNSIGGNIFILTNNLNLADRAQISTQSIGAANAGEININARQLNANRSEIRADAERAGGGNININAENIRLRNSSPIIARIGEGTSGGNIFINAKTFIALEDSDILATAIRGNGGRININSPVFLADIFALGGRGVVSDSRNNINNLRGNNRVDISASSQFGFSGTVIVPDFTFLENSLSTIEANFVNPDQIVAGSCIARRNVEQGSFTVTGTGGLPVTPYSNVDAWYSLGGETTPNLNTSTLPRKTDLATLQNSEQNINKEVESEQPWQMGKPITEAQAIVKTASGRTLLGMMPQQLTMQDANSLICN